MSLQIVVNFHVDFCTKREREKKNWNGMKCNGTGKIEEDSNNNNKRRYTYTKYCVHSHSHSHTHTEIYGYKWTLWPNQMTCLKYSCNIIIFSVGFSFLLRYLLLFERKSAHVVFAVDFFVVVLLLLSLYSFTLRFECVCLVNWNSATVCSYSKTEAIVTFNA